jgi:AraC-like DNA-binding protein
MTSEVHERPAFVPIGYCRVGPLCSIPALLGRFGCDALSMLSRTDLPPDVFANPDQIMSYPDACRLLDHCATVTGCAHFGLLVGQSCSLAGLGFVGTVVRASNDVAGALRTLVRYLPLFDRGSVLSIRAAETDVWFAYGIVAGGVRGAAQAYDLSLMIAFNTLKELCGSCWSPSFVTLPHRAPADVRPFQALFGTKVTFDASEAALVFDRFWLGRPLALSAGAERLRLLDRAARIEAMLDITTSEQVRRQLRANLPTHWLSEKDAASRLQMTTRTLRRRLADEGTRFRAIVDQLRHETALQFLSTSRLECADIALLLGYSESSVFSRAFRRWSGQSPDEWRSVQVTETAP